MALRPRLDHARCNLMGWFILWSLCALLVYSIAANLANGLDQ
jgi:hypothetical protein